jgi:peptide/nickel transport system substrate-binding protein/oligopeptide transport system substrate-binding protein
MQAQKRPLIAILPALSSLLCIIALLLTSCNSTNNPGNSQGIAPANKQIYVSPISGERDIATFDPALASDLASINMVDMVFTGLVSMNNKLEVQKELATSYQLSGNGTTWTFQLKPNLKFSDGTPLTSQDVAYSINRALLPATKSGIATTYLGMLKDANLVATGKLKTLIGDSILTPDKQTVVLITQKPVAYFLEALSYPCSYVVEPSMIQKYGASFSQHLQQGIGGAGPWMVSKYARGQEIVFVPNPNYSGPKPRLKKVVIPFYQSVDTSYQAYQVNQLDSAGVPSSDVPAAEKLPDQQYRTPAQLDIYYYGMNFLTKPFDNIKIRQAFELAINKSLIAQRIYQNTVIPTNHFVPQGMPGYDAQLTGPDGTQNLSGNPTLAKKLFAAGLQEEGYTLQTLPPITLNISSGDSVDVRNEATVVQSEWKTVLGANVRINDNDITTLFAAEANTTGNASLQMWRGDWIADYPDPQDWMTLLYDQGSPRNNENYGQNHSAAAAEQQANQQLMEKADGNTNTTERMQEYNQAEQQLSNDVVKIPLFQNIDTYLLKPCVSGIVDNAEGITPPDAWSNIYINNNSDCANTASYQ